MKKTLSVNLFFALIITSMFSICSLCIAETKGVLMKDLVVYYSYTGKTETAAKALAQELNADVLRIEDTDKVSTFKAYIKGAYAARKGLAWPVKAFKNDLSEYSRIFVGAPIWWGMCAPEINAFIDQVNFTGKSAVVFVTMGGSSPDAAIKALSSRIEAKGGKISSSFFIKTGGVNKEDIASKAKDISTQYK
jgi:flavodoxin